MPVQQSLEKTKGMLIMDQEKDFSVTRGNIWVRSVDLLVFFFFIHVKFMVLMISLGLYNITFGEAG